MALDLLRLFRRARYGRPIVLVSGLPRSGTSMLMKMLDAGGLAVVSDGLRAADEDNPRGYFEDERVKNLAQDPDKRWLQEARGKAIKIISYLLKELPPQHNYKVLFVRRDLREVLASQAKMLARRGESSDASNERMLELFESDLWKAAYLLRRRPQFEVLELRYAEVVALPEEQGRRMAAFLGQDLDVGAMVRAVDPSLHRNRAK